MWLRLEQAPFSSLVYRKHMRGKKMIIQFAYLNNFFEPLQ